MFVKKPRVSTCVITFFCGVASGYLLCYCLEATFSHRRCTDITIPTITELHERSSLDILVESQPEELSRLINTLSKRIQLTPNKSATFSSNSPNQRPVMSGTEVAGVDPDSNHVAESLSKTIRVLCLVITYPGNHKTRAVRILNTWGRHCNKILFVTTKYDTQIPSIFISGNYSEDHNTIWGKVRRAFKYAHDKHINDFDWFLKADDDTFAIIENLRYMVKSEDPEDMLYYGLRFKPYVKQGYMSGGAGYVLSKGALRKFAKVAYNDDNLCRGDDEGAEDVEMGKCMQNIGVKAEDSRDVVGKGRFFPFDPAWHVAPEPEDKNYWYWKNIWYPEKRGLDCCSDTVISFHYIKPQDFDVLEYFVYHARPYGGSVVFDHRSKSRFRAKPRLDPSPVVEVTMKSIPSEQANNAHINTTNTTVTSDLASLEEANKYYKNMLSVLVHAFQDKYQPQ